MNDLWKKVPLTFLIGVNLNNTKKKQKQEQVLVCSIQ